MTTQHISSQHDNKFSRELEKKTHHIWGDRIMIYDSVDFMRLDESKSLTGQIHLTLSAVFH